MGLRRSLPAATALALLAACATSGRGGASRGATPSEALGGGAPDAGAGGASRAPCTQAPPAASAPPPSSLPPMEGTPRWESVTAGAFHDEYLYEPGGAYKIGIRREWGGAIVFFGEAGAAPGANPTNVIDANDTGREVQVALYDRERLYQGCAANASCAQAPTACPRDITHLGWDPVQGGNRCDVGSPLLSVAAADGALSTLTAPLQWNPDWRAPGCGSGGCAGFQADAAAADVHLEQRIRFRSPRVVEVEYAATNLTATPHGATAQEFPTLYAANGKGGPALAELFDSEGNGWPIDGGSGTFHKDLQSAGGWVSFQNAQHDGGVALYYENGTSAFQAWQSTAPAFNNVRGQVRFGLPPQGTVRGRAYLILGGLADVAREARSLDGALGPFGALDAPGPAAGGPLTLSGWALDNRGVTRVEVRIDGQARGDASLGRPRPGVCEEWPGYVGCAVAGFEATVDGSALSGSDCGHLVELFAHDADGHAQLIGRRVLAPNGAAAAAASGP